MLRELTIQSKILNSIINRRRTFLEQPIWKEIPWDSVIVRKTQLDQLIDMLCDYPGLLEDADMAQRLGTPAEDVRLIWMNILRQCQKKLAALIQWQRIWNNNFKGCFREVVIEPSDTCSRFFSTIRYFTNIWRAQEFCIQNALRILLLRLYRRACEMVHVSAADAHAQNND